MERGVVERVRSDGDHMKLFVFNPRHKQAGLRIATAFASLAVLISTNDLTEAAKLRNEQSVAMR
ncbi:MAG: hypothetical protein WBW99_21530, partial [Pseudolabrys sp.]